MSHNLSKLKGINEKLNTLNASMDAEKISKFDHLHQKMNESEEKLNEISDQASKKFNIVKENLQKIQSQIENEKIKTETLFDQKSQLIKALESKINERFLIEAEKRKEIERKFISSLDDKFNSLKIEISKESRIRFENIENLKSYLENDIPKLQQTVKNEQLDRENGDNLNSENMANIVNQFYENINSEKKSREETEEAILDMLRIMITKTKSEIEGERKDRELTEETLLTLLEDTCNKLNAASQI